MADELQALLDQITEKELKKADGEKEKILSQAKQEASDIVKQARGQAETIVADAKKEAEMLAQKGEEALKQASRDVLISLRKTLESRVNAVVSSLLQGATTGADLAKVVATLVSGFVKSDGTQDDIQVLLPPAELASVEAAVKSALAEDLKSHVTLAPNARISAGFQLSFKESGVMYDFTDQALAETVAAYVSPKIAAILTDGK
ncbi:MAG: hypothetical protein IJJ26_00910 [Victivallales bacterium]|nr:hypothetical protein [Victivallales bacterium]